METEKFDCFLALAETLNFTKASQIMHKSQSVLSRQIASLEEELGFPLFLRDSKSCTLTAAGVNMRNGVEKMQRQFDRLVAESKEISEGLRGSLRVSVPSGETNDHYYMLFKAFTDECPNTTLTLTAYDVKNLDRYLRESTVDIAFSVATNPWFSSVNRPEFRNIKVGVRHDCLYIPADHPLAGKDTSELTLYDFRNETFLVLECFETNPENGPTIKTFARAGFRPKIKYMNTLSDMIVSMQSHQGICIASNRLFMYSNPRFKKLYLRDLNTHSEIILWDSENPNPCIDSFVRCVRHYISEHADFAERDVILDQLPYIGNI